MPHLRNITCIPLLGGVVSGHQGISIGMDEVDDMDIPREPGDYVKIITSLSTDCIWRIGNERGAICRDAGDNCRIYIDEIENRVRVTARSAKSVDSAVGYIAHCTALARL